jgi:hypothetical protein
VKKALAVLLMMAAGGLRAAVTTEQVTTVSAVSSTTFMGTNVALDSLNTVHVTYYDPASQRLRYTKLVNGQTTWSAPINVIDQTVSPRSDMKLSGNTPHVVFYEIDATGSRAGVKHTQLNGSTFQSPTTIQSFVSTITYVSLAVASNGQPRVAFNNTVSSATVYAAYSGTVWSTHTVHISSYPTAVVLDLASDDTPRLAFLTGGDSLGLPDDRLGYFAVGGSTPTVKGWWPVDWATAPPSGLALAVDDNNQSHIFDSYTSGGSPWIEYYLASSTGGFLNYEPVGGGSEFLDAAVNSLERPTVVYLSTAPGFSRAAWNGTGWEYSVLDGSAAVAGVGPSVVYNRFDHFLATYYTTAPAAAVHLQTDANRGLTLGGTVQDFAAAAIPGAVVQLAGSIATGNLPAGTGSYSQLNLWEGGYTVTPSAAGYAFVPASQSFASFQATNTTVNFVGGPVNIDVADNLFDPSKGEIMTVNYSVLPGAVLVRVYTLRGVPVKTLVDGSHAAGAFSTTWDGRNDAGEIVASGIYLIRIEADRLNKILKAAVVK